MCVGCETRFSGNEKAVDEDDYETFFEYRMDQYSQSGVVGRGATKATADLGEKLFAMVVDALVPMVKNAFMEDKPIPKYNGASNSKPNNKNNNNSTSNFNKVRRNNRSNHSSINRRKYGTIA